jgi:hypothetical protein
MLSEAQTVACSFPTKTGGRVRLASQAVTVAAIFREEGHGKRHYSIRPFCSSEVHKLKRKI